MRASAALSSVLAIVAVVGGAAFAHADEKAPPCLRDIKRLCGLVPPAGPFVQECLQGHRGQLSPECSQHVNELTRDTLVLVAACRWDLARFCPGAQDVAGGRASCLVSHRDDLSPKCRDQLNAESSK
jgi:hypothetical protein